MREVSLSSTKLGALLLSAPLLALACLSGCGAEATPTYVAAPSGGSGFGARPATWQQFCEQAPTVAHASALAVARGADGWELVGMSNGVLCFKRPMGGALEARPELAPRPPAPIAGPAGRDIGF